MSRLLRAIKCRLVGTTTGGGFGAFEDNVERLSRLLEGFCSNALIAVKKVYKVKGASFTLGLIGRFTVGRRRPILFFSLRNACAS